MTAADEAEEMAGDADAAASCSANVSAKDYGECAGTAVVYVVLPTCEQLVRRDKIMTATWAIAASAMFAGLAIGTASTAWADQTMSGHYIKTETTQDNEQTATSDWYFTPCGDGCANVTSSWRRLFAARNGSGVVRCRR